MLPRPTPPRSAIDTRHGTGAELLLRISIIAIEGRADGISASELRRLLGYPGATLDRMDDRSFSSLVESSGTYIGTALLIARHPKLARKHAKGLLEAVELTRKDMHLPGVFRIASATK